MASLAMVKAGVQTVSKPTFWEKTVHGLFETTETRGIELLGSRSEAETVVRGD
jgi:hypothetical protein